MKVPLSEFPESWLRIPKYLDKVVVLSLTIGNLKPLRSSSELIRDLCENTESTLTTIASTFPICWISSNFWLRSLSSVGQTKVKSAG